MLNVFALRDNKISTYLKPVMAAHLVELQRGLVHIVTDRNSVIGQNPGDFELYKFGEFDEQSGKFTMKDQPEFILNCQELVQTQPTGGKLDE